MTTAIGISGSPSTTSKSRRLLAHGLLTLERDGIHGRIVDLGELPAAALLGREPAASLRDAVDGVVAANIVLLATPVYRASYSGLLKVFFDLLPPGALTGKVVVPMATGGSAAHALVIDHALRPLIASLGGLSTAAGVYGMDGQFGGDGAAAELIGAVEHAVREASALSTTLPSLSSR